MDLDLLTSMARQRIVVSPRVTGHRRIPVLERSAGDRRRGPRKSGMRTPAVPASLAAMSTPDLADRVAIRELVDAYAHCADRRDAEGQKALFTEDARFVVYMDGQGSEPTYELQGREALTPVFADLNRYQATTHFNGQSTIALDGDRATGESYCLAHHLLTEDGERSMFVAALRYDDTFVKAGGAWRFSERRLFVDWTDTRPSRP